MELYLPTTVLVRKRSAYNGLLTALIISSCQTDQKCYCVAPLCLPPAGQPGRSEILQWARCACLQPGR